MRCDRVGEVGGARLAEDLADRVEQDRPSSPARRSASSAAATGSGAQDHARLPRRTACRRRSGAGRAPTRAGRGSRIVGQALLLDPARDALRERALDHRREERQDVDLEGHGSARRPASSGAGRRASAVAAGPAAASAARRLGPLRVGRPRPRPAAGRATSASTTISPRRGAKIADERPDRRQVERARPARRRRRRPRSRRRGRCPATVPELGAVDAADRRSR